MIALLKRSRSTISLGAGELVIQLGIGGVYHVPIPKGAVFKNMKVDKVFSNNVLAEATIESPISNEIDWSGYRQTLTAKGWRVEGDASGLTASSRNPEGGFLTISPAGSSWHMKVSWFGD